MERSHFLRRGENQRTLRRISEGWALKMENGWICSGAEYLVYGTGEIVAWMFSSLIHNCNSYKPPALILKDFPFYSRGIFASVINISQSATIFRNQSLTSLSSKGRGVRFYIKIRTKFCVNKCFNVQLIHSHI